MEGNYKHDYSEIRVPVLAFVGYPGPPQDQIRENHVTDAAERTIIEAVYGTNVGMTKKSDKKNKGSRRWCTGGRVMGCESPGISLE